MSDLVVVTGGTRGLGASMSLAFKRSGYLVAAVYNNNQDQANRFALDHNINVFKFDVSNYDECLVGVKKIKDYFKKPVAVLVNNAGITKDKSLLKMSQDEWHDVINTNLNSCFYMSKIVLEEMRQQNFGRIINISSVNGQKGQFGQTNYAAAKAGIIGFTKALAQECAKYNITVNAIAPGYINTQMTQNMPQNIKDQIIQSIPVGRLGQPEEIANACLFLAQNSFTTGATLSINGGQYFN